MVDKPKFGHSKYYNKQIKDETSSLDLQSNTDTHGLYLKV